MKAQAWERRGRVAMIVPDADGVVSISLSVLIDLLHEAGWRPVDHPDDSGHPRTTEL